MPSTLRALNWILKRSFSITRFPLLNSVPQLSVYNASAQPTPLVKRSFNSHDVFGTCMAKPGRLLQCTRKYSSAPPTAAETPLDKEEDWQIQKAALKRKFGDKNWAPVKRLSPDAIEGVRTLHAQDARKYTTEALAEEFKVSPEAIRRILKSKWRPTEEEQADRQSRWIRRGERIWSKKMNIGMKAPKKWRVAEASKIREERRGNVNSIAAYNRKSASSNGLALDIKVPRHSADGDEAGSEPSLASRIL